MRMGAPSNPRAVAPLPAISNSKVLGQAAAATAPALPSNSRSSRGGQPTGVIKFSNPALGGQPIKVDLSSVVTSGQRRAPSPLGPARKLELDEGEKGDRVKVEDVKSEVEVKKEDFHCQYKQIAAMRPLCLQTLKVHSKGEMSIDKDLTG